MKWVVFLAIISFSVAIPVFIGGYDDTARAYDLDSNGILTLTDIYRGIAPSTVFWAQSPVNNGVVYGVQEDGGHLMSFALSRGSLVQTSEIVFEHPKQRNPFILVEPKGRWLYLSRDQDIQLVDLLPNGNLGSVRAKYPNGNNTECISYDPTGKFMFGASYGEHVVGQWSVGEDGNLTSLGVLPFPFGSSPHYIIFGPHTPSIAYLMAENAAQVYSLNNTNGNLSVISVINSTGLHDHVHGVGSILQISNDEKFLYAGNRWPDQSSIAIFSIGAGGILTRIKDENGGGDINWPRYYHLDPSQNFMVVANRRSFNIVALKRDNQTGLLTKTSTKVARDADPTFVGFFNMELGDPIDEDAASTLFIGLFAFILCLF